MQAHSLNRYFPIPDFIFKAFCGLLLLVSGLAAQASAQATAPAKAPPVLGTIQTIANDSLTLKTDSGTDLKVQLPAEVKVFRVPPGSKDLKDATPIQLSDLQPGDRVLIRPKQGQDTSSFVASMIVAMKKADIAVKQQKDLQEWQRHGIGGLVSAVDAAQNSITIKTLSAAGSKDVVIHAGQNTILRRYAPGSVNFDDAKVAPLTEVKPGDQLRARGTRSADGAQFTADEIVSGSFQNIAGLVVATNPADGTMTLNDLATKKQVQLKVTAQSQMRKLPEQMAQGIAIRLKAAGAAGANGSAPQAASSSTPASQPGGAPPAAAGQRPGGGSGNGPGGGASGPGGPPQRGGGDLQQLLSRLPASPITDFQKGDAVMVVATAGQGDGPSTVITLLGGVEPILQATSQSQAASILSPWSLNQSGGGDAGTP
jgi:hypothetical protein